MRKLILYTAVFSVFIVVANPTRLNAQYLLANQKYVFEPTDSIEFWYIYPLPQKHALFLTVTPIGNNGNRLTAAADLGKPGGDKQVYHAKRFGIGKFKMTLSSFVDNNWVVRVEAEFEIRKERKKYLVGTFELEDNEQKTRLSSLKKIIKEKTPPYEIALKKYNAVIPRLVQLQQQIDKLNKERNHLIGKIGRTTKKIKEDEDRQSRLKEIRSYFQTGSMPPGKTTLQVTSERDSLQKIVDDNKGSINAARVELSDATKSHQLAETKLKNLAGRPLTTISEELEEAKMELKATSEALRQAEVNYYENKSMSAIEEIKITSGGNTVYQASWSWTKDQMLRQLLDDLKTDSAKAAQAKKKAFDIFMAAKKEEIAAGKKLGGWTGEIMKSAYKTAAIEGLFHSIDIGQAWVKGGPALAFAEAAKKLAEAYIKDELTLSGSPFKQGTIEAELFREYDLMIVDPHRADEITAHVNLVIENQQKKDFPKQALWFGGDKAVSWLLDQIKEHELAAVKTIEIVTKTDKWAEFLGGKIDAGVNFGKDQLKKALVTWAKSAEQKAWMDYILKGREARFLYAHYAIAANHYRKVDSLYHEVLANYAAYVNNTQIESRDPFNVAVNNHFYEGDNLQFVVKMKKEAPGYKDRIVIGGSEALYQSPHRFTKSVGAELSEETQGKVKLNLFLFTTPMNGWNPLSYEH